MCVLLPCISHQRYRSEQICPDSSRLRDWTRASSNWATLNLRAQKLAWVTWRKWFMKRSLFLFVGECFPFLDFVCWSKKGTPKNPSKKNHHKQKIPWILFFIHVSLVYELCFKIHPLSILLYFSLLPKIGRKLTKLKAKSLMGPPRKEWNRIYPIKLDTGWYASLPRSICVCLLDSFGVFGKKAVMVAIALLLSYVIWATEKKTMFLTALKSSREARFGGSSLRLDSMWQIVKVCLLWDAFF